MFDGYCRMPMKKRQYRAKQMKIWDEYRGRGCHCASRTAHASGNSMTNIFLHRTDMTHAKMAMRNNKKGKKRKRKIKWKPNKINVMQQKIRAIF